MALRNTGDRHPGTCGPAHPPEVLQLCSALRIPTQCFQGDVSHTEQGNQGQGGGLRVLLPGYPQFRPVHLSISLRLGTIPPHLPFPQTLKRDCMVLMDALTRHLQKSKWKIFLREMGRASAGSTGTAQCCRTGKPMYLVSHQITQQHSC